MSLARLRNIDELWTFARFIVVGLFNTAFGYAVFALLIQIGVPRPGALLFATVLGVLFNFHTTGIAVFRQHDYRLLTRFFAVYAFVYLVNLGLLEGFCRLLQFGPLVAQALSIPFNVVLSFALMRRFVFKPTLDGDNGGQNN
jgi:putative flippase GtrA